MALFALEIGTEELPSRFLAGEEEYLRQRFTDLLGEQGLEHGVIDVFTSPRRACVFIYDLSPLQAEKEEEVSGPPVRVAYKDGTPSKALEGFCRTNGVALSDVYKIKTPKGEYIAVKKKTGGRPAKDILAEFCPGIISQIPFGKRMHWGSSSFLFARPMQWILALLDSEIVPFEVGPVKSGRETFGHRIHGRGPFTVEFAGDLFSVLATKCVLCVDSQKRREQIIAEADRQAEAVSGKILWNDALLQEVCGLVEHPVSLLADFDPCYLEVPREVLITSMQTHQKSFGVEDAEGKLLPHFVTVLNLDPEDISVVKHGWERVLRARLEDARFFWREDLKQNFDFWLEKLDHVIFIRGLGSMGDKTRRLEALCGYIADCCAPAERADAMRAGRLSKADLVSGLVGEFDTLQGIMGGIYAEKMGESEAVAKGLRCQYLPAGPDSPLPDCLTGAILSIADKADTLAGCFGLNMIPTGAADPNGLRRCALGIIRILRHFGLKIDLRDLFSRALAGYSDITWKLAPVECIEKLMDFFAARLRNYYQMLGMDTLLIDAALGADTKYVKGIDDRLNALVSFSSSPEYTLSVQTFKRVANIVKKQSAQNAIPERWNPALFQEEAEKSLGQTLEEVLPKMDALWEAADHNAALAMLQTLRPVVDGFFDQVMVACEDSALRANRLAMLRAMADRFARIADFSALQI